VEPKISHRPAAGAGGLANARLVITYEYGGNRIPKPYCHLFHADQALLRSHRGFDPGARIMARVLATALAAPLVVSSVSRLLVDLNRSVGHPRLHSQTIREVPAAVRERIARRYYEPYRALVARLVRQAIATLQPKLPASAPGPRRRVTGVLR
jgi:predicted N-formylglutamate amidohydrolase